MHLMIPAITIKATLAGFAALGLDAAALAASTNVRQSDLDDPFGAVPNDTFARLWLAAFAQESDPTLPTRAGLAVPFNAFGMLDHLVTTAATTGEGLHILNLFLWLVSTNMHLDFTHDHGDWVWVENDPQEPSYFIAEQWTLAVIYQQLRSRMPPFTIEEVQLSQKAAGVEEAFTALWGVPVRLGQRRTGFRLAHGVWSHPNAQAQAHLQQTLRTVAERVAIKQFEDAPLIYAIRTRLPAALQNGAFSAEDIAAELGLSKRTLQRRLAEEGIAFKELLDIYRQEHAMLLLQNGERDMADVAYALGYQEQSSFNRAFRRWTGMAPRRWIAHRPASPATSQRTTTDHAERLSRREPDGAPPGTNDAP